MFGNWPLWFGKGPGGGARNRIGIMLVRGMIIGTFFTRRVVPSIYMLVAREHQAVRTAEVESDAEAGSELAPATV